nr:(2Fe-2S) ferredoxin domain-containing protein [Motilibacter aurantiacus]
MRAVEALRALAARAQAHAGVPVTACFLDGAEPSLHAALDGCVRHRAAEVVVVPATADGYLAQWAARAPAHWRERAGADGPPVLVAPPVAEQPGMLEALASAVAGAAEAPPVSPAGFRSPAWTVLPRPRTHLLLCRGPRCTAYGSGDVLRALSQVTRDRGISEVEIMITPTGCLTPCNLGPLAVAYPVGRWHTGLSPEQAAAVVEECLPPREQPPAASEVPGLPGPVPGPTGQRDELRPVPRPDRRARDVSCLSTPAGPPGPQTPNRPRRRRAPARAPRAGGGSCSCAGTSTAAC